MKVRPLTGTITALVTPFLDGQVSYIDLKKLVGYQIKNGINGLVPMGTTGESPTLNYEEHMDVIRFVISEVRGRVPVKCACCGTVIKWADPGKADTRRAT